MTTNKYVRRGWLSGLVVTALLIGITNPAPAHRGGAEATPDNRWTFTDVTESVGLSGTGTSLCWSDFNNDNYPDFLIYGEKTCRLLQNNRGQTFLDVTKKMKLSPYPGQLGLGLFGDYDNDGDLDIFLLREPPYYIYRNERNKSFTQITGDTIGLTYTTKVHCGGFGDFNRDGRIDLYVGGSYAANHLPTDPNILWQNTGGRFEEVTTEVGLERDMAFSWGITWADFNNDGWLDLYVGHYHAHAFPNYFAINQKGHFSILQDKSWLDNPYGRTSHNIGVTAGDYNNDGNIDLYLATIHDDGVLLQNDGQGGFEDVAKSAGIARGYMDHAGCAWGDIDNDGNLDLISILCSGYPGKSFLNINNGDGTFSVNTTLLGEEVRSSYDCLFVDYNLDGALDFVTPGKLYRNNLHNQNAWIEVKPQGKHCNISGIGARIEVSVPQGGTGNVTRVREIDGGHGAAVQMPAIAHFGLGPGVAQVDIEIRWPCGKVTKRKNIRVNQVITIKEE